MPFYFDWTFLLLIPGFIFGLYAQMKVRSAYTKLSKVMSARGVTGAMVAREILAGNDIPVMSDAQAAASSGKFGVTVEHIGGQMTDHFDPGAKAVRLSDGVYNSSSIAAIGIAAHEVGHVIQHATDYGPMRFRAGIFPLVNLGSHLWWIIFMVGIFAGIPQLLTVGIFLFTAIVIFQLVTLPVEFNASKRALVLLTNRGLITEEERPLVKQVLSAAALTYVAALVMSILTLIRLLIIRDRR